MISSTARDLPEHRKEVLDACLRQSMIPEDDGAPARPADAEAVSRLARDGGRGGNLRRRLRPPLRLRARPDHDDLHHRDGVQPRRRARASRASSSSWTKQPPVRASDVETGEGAEKLKTFKERLKTENIVSFFKSPDDLRAHVINSLSQASRQPDLTTFHYVSDIPAAARTLHRAPLHAAANPPPRRPPAGTQPPHRLGRQAGLEVYQARILNVVAIGGMGKSALDVEMVQRHRPAGDEAAGRPHVVELLRIRRHLRELRHPRARLRHRAARSKKSNRYPPPNAKTQLLAALDREPFLLVLDGLERILIAYARMDAAHLSDDDYDKQTANCVANAYGLPASAAQSFTGEHRLRKTADPRAGSFLRKLATRRASRILVSTRLYPADLQTVTGEAISGSCSAYSCRAERRRCARTVAGVRRRPARAKHCCRFSTLRITTRC